MSTQAAQGGQTQQRRPVRAKQRPGNGNGFQKVESEIKRLQRLGGIPIEIQSVAKLVTGEKNYKFFAGDEDRKGYGHLASYALGGKNPIESQTGKLVGFQVALHGPEFAALNLAGNGNYAVLDGANKLIELLRYKITKNKTLLREGSFKSIIEPLPRILRPFQIGTGTTNGHVSVAAVQAQTGNIEEKTSHQRVVYQPIDFKDNDSLIFEVMLPSGGTGVDIALNDHLLVINALGAEFPKGTR